MLMHVTAVSHFAGALAYSLAAALILASRTQHRYKGLLLAACIATACWAGAVGTSALFESAPLLLNIVITVLDQVRSIAWMTVVAFVLFVAYGKKVDRTVAIFVTIAVLSAMVYSVTVPVL